MHGILYSKNDIYHLTWPRCSKCSYGFLKPCADTAQPKYEHLCCAKRGYQLVDERANFPDQFDKKQGERSERER